MNNSLYKNKDYLKEFLKLIKKQKYFEAHEFLENYWDKKNKLDNYNNLLKGFINAAVALELKKRGKTNYNKVWDTYKKYKNIYIKNNNNIHKDIIIIIKQLEKEINIY